MKAQSDLGRFDGNGPILPLLFFTAPVVTSVLPRLTPLFLFLIGLTLVLPSLRRGQGIGQLLASNSALSACLVFALYIFINASWALDQGAALSKAALLLGAILIVFAGAPIFAGLSGWQIRRTAVAFVAGALLGALYLMLELITEAALTRAFMNAMAILPERAKHIAVVKGEVKSINLSEFNQNITLLTFHLWPGVLILSAVKNIPYRTLAIILFTLAFAIPILVSEHDSSIVALFGSILVFFVARFWSRATIRALAALWCLGFVLILPLNFLAYNAQLHLAEPLPASHRARIIIWEYTSERTLERPLFGIGMDSTPGMHPDPPLKTAPSQREKPEGFVFKRTTAHHAHNIFLQSWYELGLIGAILLATTGVLVVMRIDLLPPRAQPYAAAAFAAFALIASFAWGMWQTWFMCAVALLPLYVAIASVTARSPTDSLSDIGSEDR
ncbi:MAG: O-antigen ligase family protein [Alphaproteobacteria bacterium]|nr:O-antigen ligase family protein [Alphaproteobacteria bacterium]